MSVDSIKPASVNIKSEYLVSCCFMCQVLGVKRRLMQKLVLQKQLNMHNGLLDLAEVLRLFPNLSKFNLMD
ncbi:hypothetical protein SPONN_2713 [uncultured Candidatus Thioglobus sp.]|nr:hypothetical protein SPONN_2713 [uncultured Candidatus Thioglobus sp.]